MSNECRIIYKVWFSFEKVWKDWENKNNLKFGHVPACVQYYVSVKIQAHPRSGCKNSLK